MIRIFKKIKKYIYSIDNNSGEFISIGLLFVFNLIILILATRWF